MRIITTLVMTFILGACGGGGGSGSTSSMDMPPAALPSMSGSMAETPSESSSSVPESEPGSPVPNQPEQTSPQSPQTTPAIDTVPTVPTVPDALTVSSSNPNPTNLDTPGSAPQSAEFTLDYAVFGAWAATTFASVADVIDNNGVVGFRHSSPGNSNFKISSFSIRDTHHGYTYEGPAIGVHYGNGGTSRLEGTVFMEYTTNNTFSTLDNGMYIRFSEELPVLTGGIPLDRALGHNERAVEGEHNGRLFAPMSRSNFTNHSATYTGMGEEIDAVKLSGFVQNKRYDGTTTTTGDYYAVGTFTATKHDVLTFEGLFAAPGTAP